VEKVSFEPGIECVMEGESGEQVGGEYTLNVVHGPLGGRPHLSHRLSVPA